ncbi:MAG: glutathione S-transferase [Xanthomonadales bacterium]|nr:MAPEG family protein [Gammaproteobacteria bacterium]NNE06289.1 glutathione S-transferase [Xanthomonadales bacterium]NNL94044.1 glutathione S-transferase [Xanthomonadales bacterium]
MNFPVTTFYASLLGLIFVFLSARVSFNRRRAKVSLGLGEDAGLERANRAQGNFIEYVPIALILLLLLEQEVSQMWLLHTLGAALLGGRLMHAWGLARRYSVNMFRTWGTVITWLMIMATALLNLWHSI